MTSSIFLKIEVLLLIASFWYILFYFGNYLFKVFFNIKKIIKPQTKLGEHEEKDAPKNIVSIEKNTPTKSNFEEDKKEKKLTENQKNKLIEIIKKVRINSSKSYYDAAKSLIVEWLAIDKYNKDLNLELAIIYEAEKNFKNAEYIYRDLVELHNDNYEILKRLGYILALQKRFDESITFYEQAHDKNKWDVDVVDLLTDLHYEIGSYEHAYKYVILSLKQKPRSIERLILRAELSLREGKESDAIEAYRQVLDIQPYNTEALDGMRSLGQKIK